MILKVFQEPLGPLLCIRVNVLSMKYLQIINTADQKEVRLLFIQVKGTSLRYLRILSKVDQKGPP